jgi:hypothetical protein
MLATACWARKHPGAGRLLERCQETTVLLGSRPFGVRNLGPSLSNLKKDALHRVEGVKLPLLSMLARILVRCQTSQRYDDQQRDVAIGHQQVSAGLDRGVQKPDFHVALLTIGPKKKPRLTESTGASKTGRLRGMAFRGGRTDRPYIGIPTWAMKRAQQSQPQSVHCLFGSSITIVLDIAQ